MNEAGLQMIRKIREAEAADYLIRELVRKNLN